MAVKEQKIYIPTGFESQQRAAERRRKIADALLAQGLGQQGHMQSWMQVLGQIGQAGAGAYLGNKADKMEDETDKLISSAYADAVAKFKAKADALDPASPNYDADLRNLAMEGKSNPWTADIAESYVDAHGARLKSQGEFKKWGGRATREGAIPMGSADNDPNSMVFLNDDGTLRPNTTRITTALASQPNVDIDPSAIAQIGQLTGRMPENAPSPMPPAAATAPPSPASMGGFDISKMDPQDIEIVNKMLEKYAGPGNTITGMIPNNVPYGNPTDPSLGGTKPPDGVTTDGQPYWIVNGVPYDNPEGR